MFVLCYLYAAITNAVSSDGTVSSVFGDVETSHTGRHEMWSPAGTTVTTTDEHGKVSEYAFRVVDVVWVSCACTFGLNCH